MTSEVLTVAIMICESEADTKIKLVIIECLAIVFGNLGILIKFAKNVFFEVILHLIAFR